MNAVARVLFLLGLALVAALAQAQDLLAVPALTGRVIDQTSTLESAARDSLEQELQGIEQRHGSQIVVLMVATTRPEDIASYANRVANQWKIGRKGVGDGLLVVVVKNDRKVRIEVAKSLEGAIPDLAARQIIDEAITPRFRQGDFGGGLLAALNRIEQRLSGEALPAPSHKASDSGTDWKDWGVFLFVAVAFLAPLARRLLGQGPGAIGTASVVGVLAWMFSASLVVALVAALVAAVLALFAGHPALGRAAGGHGGGRSSSSGGSSSSDSGGGFSSGGGGDFGGGGASGDW